MGTNKCRVNNGGCSSLCLATPGSRQCACAEDQVLDADGVTCLGMRAQLGWEVGEQTPAEGHSVWMGIGDEGGKEGPEGRNRS